MRGGLDPIHQLGAGRCVKPGDFLVELGGHAIQSVGDFQKWMYVMGIGTKVELGLVRDGQPMRVTVTIEARPPEATNS